MVKKIFARKLHVYYIDSGWLGDQYCLLLAETVILVEAVGRDQYQLHQNYYIFLPEYQGKKLKG